MDLLSFIERTNKQYGLTRPPPPICKKKEIEKDEDEKCYHYNTVTHTNGSVQCLKCKEMLKIIEREGKGGG